jgi:hypothetical protein
MSLNSRALVLASTPCGHERLTAVPFEPAVPAQTLGPGRLLHHAYSSAGQHLEKSAGHLAHLLGHGPEAAANLIEKVFGNDIRERQSRLEDLYKSFNGQPCKSDRPDVVRELKKHCRKLAKYAHP